MTARVTPIGTTMVGGAADYRPLCRVHFQLECIYVNPSNLLADPEIWRDQRWRSSGLCGRDFCAAIAAAKLQLEAGVELESLICPHCEAPHLDERAFELRQHHCHQCQECGELWEAGHRGVSNPLA